MNVCGDHLLVALDVERVSLKQTLERLPATPLGEGVSPWRQGCCHWLAPGTGDIKAGSENSALTVLTGLGRCRRGAERAGFRRGRR